MIWAPHLRCPGEAWEILSLAACFATLNLTPTLLPLLSALQGSGMRAAMGYPRNQATLSRGAETLCDGTRRLLSHPIPAVRKAAAYPRAAV